MCTRICISYFTYSELPSAYISYICDQCCQCYKQVLDQNETSKILVLHHKLDILGFLSNETWGQSGQPCMVVCIHSIWSTGNMDQLVTALPPTTCLRGGLPHQNTTGPQRQNTTTQHTKNKQTKKQQTNTHNEKKNKNQTNITHKIQTNNQISMARK